MKESSEKIPAPMPNGMRAAFLTWLRVLLLAMVMLALSRVLLLVLHHSHFADMSWDVLARAWGTGVRFDLATALLTIGLPTTFLWLPWPARLAPYVMQVLSWLTALVLTAAAAFLWSDLLFFDESWHHLTFEPTNIFHDLAPMLKLVVTEYPLQTVGLILFCYALVRVTRRQYQPLIENHHLRPSWWAYPLMILLVGGMTVTGVRGGWQKEALRSSDAVISGPSYAGNLAMNGWYSFLVTMFDRSRPPAKYLPDDQAIAITRELVATPRDEFLSDEYPLLRRTSSTAAIVQPPEKLNVVLLVVESLNATFLQSFGGPLPVMPFLDSLATQSRIYTNCSAVATRSFRGMNAILTSVPNAADNAFAITFTLPRLRGLGEIFETNGYRTRFMHAAAPGSQGIQAIAYMAGYPDFVSEADFPEGQDNGSWGIWDHIALERMSREMDAMPEPFHYGMFTLCTHAPWALPEGFVPPFGEPVEKAEILNTFAYLDGALRDFFEREAERPRFQHTLYVIIGDHTTHASDAERFRIGCIFYAPGRLAPAVDDRPVSQLDVMPTVLDLAGIETVHAGFGHSMMDSSITDPYTLMLQSNLLYWRHHGRTYVTDSRRGLALFDPLGDPGGKVNLLPVEPDAADQLRREFEAFYQTTELLLTSNRVYPTP